MVVGGGETSSSASADAEADDNNPKSLSVTGACGKELGKVRGGGTSDALAVVPLLAPVLPIEGCRLLTMGVFSKSGRVVRGEGCGGGGGGCGLLLEEALGVSKVLVDGDRGEEAIVKP